MMMIIIKLKYMSAVSLVKSLIIVYQLHEKNTVHKMDEPVSVMCVTVTDV